MQKCIWLCGNLCSENHGSGNIILSKLSNATPKCLLPQYFLPPLPPLPHHPMHFRTHRCNNCGDKFHSLVQRSCSKRSWRSSAHWSSEMGTSYGKLTVVVNQKQWLKRRQPQRAATDPRVPRRGAARRGLPPPTLLLLGLNLYGGAAHKCGAARMRKFFKGRQITLIRPVYRGLLLFSLANYHFYWQFSFMIVCQFNIPKHNEKYVKYCEDLMSY